MASPSRKNSPDYLKSRMGTFLNPLFLSAVVGLGVIGIVAWQLIVINDQFRQSSREASPPSSTGATVELEENNNGVENSANGNGTSETTSQNTNENPSTSPQNSPNNGDTSELDIKEFDILGSRNTIEGGDRNTNNQTRLYDQVLSLPRISPQVRPSGGDGSGAVNQGLLSPEFNQQRQSSQIPVTPSPLNQAVGNVMSNYNPSSNIYRSQNPQSNIPSSGGQMYQSPSLQNNYNVGNNINGNANTWVPTPQGVNVNPNQGGVNIPSNRPAQTNQSPF
ncbi:hypothetical protein A5482_011355 [Cyanobacterium sp. IPPAS B-1200]|uniref:hypothetical protein n=1 Tax=Cyanobacterium sp. IPPAS B-1200 TaxID=1562720 RepID=UPI003D4634DE